MNEKQYGLMAEFNTPADVLHAAEKIRDAGYRRWDVFTPFPIHGLDEVMRLGNSLVGWVALGGGAFMCVGVGTGGMRLCCVLARVRVPCAAVAAVAVPCRGGSLAERAAHSLPARSPTHSLDSIHRTHTPALSHNRSSPPSWWASYQSTNHTLCTPLFCPAVCCLPGGQRGQAGAPGPGRHPGHDVWG